MRNINSNIFVPKKINVGFQERRDTYTKKLAYVIYFDEKGKLRKETSWNSWREKDIEPIIFDNEPTSGFVLNKKAGDYSIGWNHRQAYVRVYDPRNFEFEITIENLLYILENTSSIKGKGLEGDFVYGWDGKDLVLIPTSSPDYIEISKYNEVIHNKQTIKTKDLIIGATYKTKQNEHWVYMGKYDYYGWRSNGKKHFWFYNIENKDGYNPFEQIKTLGEKLIEVVDTNCYCDYADIFDKMECSTDYSPIANDKDEYEGYSLEYFIERINEEILNKNYFWSEFKAYSVIEDEKVQITISRSNRQNSDLLIVTKASIKIEKYKSGWSYYSEEKEREVKYNEVLIESENIEEIFNKLKPQYKNVYLRNGKLKKGVKNNEY